MDSLKIDLKALHEGVTTIERDLGDAYFATIGSSEAGKGRVHVSMDIRRADTVFDIAYTIDGEVTVACDRCLAEMQQPVSGEDRFVAVLGDDTDHDEETIVVDESDGILDASWPVYETIALAIPIKHVHEEGKCDPDMLRALAEHTAAPGFDDGGEETTDPRWEALKKLKTNN